MKKYLIFSDIDGTLLDCTRNLIEISDKTLYALQEVKKVAYLVLVTGRPKCFVTNRILSINPDGFILTNGAYAELNNEVIYRNCFNKKDIEHIKSYCKKTNDPLLLCCQDYCYTLELGNKYCEDFVTSMSKDPKKIIRVNDELESCDFVWLKSMTEEGRVNIEKEFTDEYNINRQQETTFDCVKKGVSKDNAIKEFIKKCNFDYEKTVCFGDGLNDVGMMKIVDYSFAMGNARDYTKSCAKEVAKDVLDDGFYYALVEHGIINPID